jgi:hypothetical protein
LPKEDFWLLAVTEPEAPQLIYCHRFTVFPELYGKSGFGGIIGLYLVCYCSIGLQISWMMSFLLSKQSSLKHSKVSLPINPNMYFVKENHLAHNAEMSVMNSC